MSITYTAFAGSARIAQGDLVGVAVAAARAWRADRQLSVLIFDDQGGAQVDLDLSGNEAAVTRRAQARDKPPRPGDDTPPRGPGRPKLGVVAREVTLLPRHWEWLADQPGGASVALRKLVEQARKDGDGAARKRQAQEACNRFMTAMAGDLPGFEDATRALFAGDGTRFDACMQQWPADVRLHAWRLGVPAFDA
jgi:hypothetical protein